MWWEGRIPLQSGKPRPPCEKATDWSHRWIAAKFSLKSVHLLTSQLPAWSGLPRALGMSYLLKGALVFSQGVIIFRPPPLLQDCRQKCSQHYCQRERVGFSEAQEYLLPTASFPGMMFADKLL